MEISAEKQEEVADPDAMVSGVAGTGQEQNISAGPAAELGCTLEKRLGRGRSCGFRRRISRQFASAHGPQSTSNRAGRAILCRRENA